MASRRKTKPATVEAPEPDVQAEPTSHQPEMPIVTAAELALAREAKSAGIRHANHVVPDESSSDSSDSEADEKANIAARFLGMPKEAKIQLSVAKLAHAKMLSYVAVRHPSPETTNSFETKYENEFIERCAKLHELYRDPLMRNLQLNRTVGRLHRRLADLEATVADMPVHKRHRDGKHEGKKSHSSKKHKGESAVEAVERPGAGAAPVPPTEMSVV